MKKKKIWIVTLIGIMSMCSGCNPMSKDNSVSSTEYGDDASVLQAKSPAELPDTYESSSDSIVFDAKLYIPDEMKDYKAKDIYLKRHVFDKTACNNILLEILGNPTVTTREAIDSDDVLDNGQSLTGEHIQIDDDTYVQTRDTYLMMYHATDTYKKRSRLALAESWLVGEGLDYLDKDLDLDFDTVGNAEKNAKSIFEKLGIVDISERETCYSCTADSMNKIVSLHLDDFGTNTENNEEAATKFTKEDEGYLIQFTQAYHGIPIIKYPMDTELVGSVWNVYGEFSAECDMNGLESISAYNAYDFVKDGKEQDIKPISDMVENFKEDMKSTVVDDPITVTEIGISYLPILQDKDNMVFHTVPVWYFQYNLPSDTNNQYKGYKKVKIYDAVTGEEYLAGI